MNRRELLGLTAIVPAVYVFGLPEKYPYNWIPNGNKAGPHLTSWDNGKTWRVYEHLESGWADEYEA